MKRPKFQISIDGKPVAIKNAWNSSLKAMPQLIRDHIPFGGAREIHKETERLDPWHFKRGRFVWQRDNGVEIVVEIELLEPQ